MKWRIVRVSSENPFMNLAIEEAILIAVDRGVVPSTLRFWVHDRTVVIGRFQCPVEEVDLEKCVKDKVYVVRRHTGGGAVYHDRGNLNYALSISKGSSRVFGNSILGNFKVVGECIADALRMLGYNANFRPINDIEIEGRKVSGMAASVHKSAVFVHGCLLVNTDVSNLTKYLRIPKVKYVTKGVKSAVKRVVTLHELKGSPVEMREVEDAIAEAFSHKLGVSFKESDLTEYEIKLAEKLYMEKYTTLEWMAHICPECPRYSEDIEKLKAYLEAIRK
ncbi:lipoate--protein ligase family protein [archaeon]|nr:MAG: lipoate--protein ligase family protein [archaeon]RLG64160.1 MAG: lipoate--protein ligase family protein [archaeon]HDM23485.1 lipoate--protein ligase family protein [Candidatus Bathyarchaeota archaeon]